MHTLTLRALDRSVGIDCEEPETQALLTATYGHMRGDPGSADLRYTVGRDRAGASFFIKREGREHLTAPDDGAFLAMFDEDIAIELQKLRRDLYFVHAAVLTISETAFMLIAESGGGKSTVCWALSHHGFRYLSDELGPVELDSLRVHGYPRAITLKTKPPAPYPIPPTTLHSSRGWHVSAENVPGGVGADMTPLATVFFLRHDAQVREPSVRRMGVAEAVARLYANTLNALAHPGDGLDAAIRITRAVSAFELTTTDLTLTSGLLAATLERLRLQKRPSPGV